MSEKNSSQAAATAVAGHSTDAVIAERGRTHGDYPEMARVQSGLHDVLLSSPGWPALPPPIRVFLLSTIQKLSRIVSGNPREPDHYRDIGGYARLAEKSLARPAELEPTVIEGGRISDLSVDKLVVSGKIGTISENTGKSSVIVIPRDVLEGICTSMVDNTGQSAVVVRDRHSTVRLYLDRYGLKIYDEKGSLILSSTSEGASCTTEMAAQAVVSGPSERIPLATIQASAREAARHPANEVSTQGGAWIAEILWPLANSLGNLPAADSYERSKAKEKLVLDSIVRVWSWHNKALADAATKVRGGEGSVQAGGLSAISADLGLVVAGRPAALSEIVETLQAETENLSIRINLSPDERTRSRARAAERALSALALAVSSQADKRAAEIHKLTEEKLRSYGAEITGLRSKCDDLRKTIETKDRVISRLAEG